MENYFLNITKQHLAQNGKSAKYVRTVSGAYDVTTGTKSNTTTQYTVIMYKRNVKINQYNHPNLIGKDVSVFYIAGDALGFLPAPQDHIIFDGVQYSVESYVEHAALGQVVMFKVLGVRG